MTNHSELLNDEQRWMGERVLLRIGAMAAVIGTILQVVAGTSQSASLGASTDLALESLAGQPDWGWPVIYLAFIFGALLWVGALIALASSLTERIAWALGRLAVAAATEETLQICPRLWHGEQGDERPFMGRHYRLGRPLSLPQPDRDSRPGDSTAAPRRHGERCSVTFDAACGLEGEG